MISAYSTRRLQRLWLIEAVKYNADGAPLIFYLATGGWRVRLACSPPNSLGRKTMFLILEVNRVQIDLEKDDHDHLITPEEHFKIAMARQ